MFKVEHTDKLDPGNMDNRMIDMEETGFIIWLVAELKEMMVVDAVLYMVVEEQSVTNAKVAGLSDDDWLQVGGFMNNGWGSRIWKWCQPNKSLTATFCQYRMRVCISLPVKKSTQEVCRR